MTARCYRSLCLVSVFIICLSNPARAQSKKYYWQQHITYKMDVKLDVVTNQFTGKQIIKYKNNSPDVLNKVFFHLYLNAFQPGSEMDVRSRTIADPDPRVEDRILHLDADEIGYQRISKLTQNGSPVQHKTEGTILEVTLAKPVRPGQCATFVMEYDAQVPIQVRRNGRDNKEGIRYSMSQWYPKMCEYDEQGWHANPYVGREFYGVWGDFDVSITLDKNYVVAATGLLQNANEIGHGYAPEPKSKPEKLTWQFVAKDVHDFVWAADPGFMHDVHTCADGLKLHTFYKPAPDYLENWKALPGIMEEAIKYINPRYGEYPYPVYSFIQGGDGGMEYPMATLITGNRSLTSLVGVSLHELLHSWYQMVLGFDESHYSWMDEGFTDYVETQVMEHLRSKQLVPGELKEFPYESSYKNYKELVEQGIEEPLSTHADHFDYNTAYSIAAYIKGSLFLNQLSYVIGDEAFKKGMLDFFNVWKFKHPDANDFIRIMEKSSGLELDWYKEYMVYSTKTVDYSIDTFYSDNDVTRIVLSREGKMPMPVDLHVRLHDGSTVVYNIPLDLMRGSKSESLANKEKMIVLEDWTWVNPFYEIDSSIPLDQIESIAIDPSRRMIDIDRSDNAWPLPTSEQ